MKRLRHPIRAIREPFGTAGLIVACLALVLALGGAAVAATGGLTGKQKKEVETIAKKYSGKPGAPGAQGPAGPTGPAGSAGKDGTNGTNGKDGTNGTNGNPGTNGKSVAVEEIKTGEAECGGAGGAFVEEEEGTTVEICNGQPWSAGGTLPKGRSEEGVWSAVTFESGLSGHPKVAVGPISFGIPLESAPTVLYVKEGETVTHCSGTAAAPAADEGYLCVYAESPSEFIATFEEAVPLYAGGVVLHFKEAVGAGVPLGGTWAVTSAG